MSYIFQAAVRPHIFSSPSVLPRPTNCHSTLRKVTFYRMSGARSTFAKTVAHFHDVGKRECPSDTVRTGVRAVTEPSVNRGRASRALVKVSFPRKHEDALRSFSFPNRRLSSGASLFVLPFSHHRRARVPCTRELPTGQRLPRLRPRCLVYIPRVQSATVTRLTYLFSTLLAEPSN